MRFMTHVPAMGGVRCLIPVVAALLLVQTSAFGTHPLDSLPAGLGDAEWNRRAAALSVERNAAPDLEVLDFESTASRIAFRFRASRMTAESRSTVALCVPEGAFVRGEMRPLATIDQRDADLVDPPALRADQATTLSVSLDILGDVRAHRVARVFVPLTLPDFPSSRTLEGRVELFFEPPTAADPHAGADAPPVGALRSALAGFVANPQDLDRFALSDPTATPPGPGVDDAGAAAFPGASHVFRLPVDRDALHRITGADLRSAGADTARLDPARARLFLRGVEQPMAWLPARADGSPGIADNDMLVFHGRANDSRFTLTNPYWLVFDAAATGLRFSPPPGADYGTTTTAAKAFHSSLVVEEDNEVLIRNDQFLSILSHRWVWRALEAGEPAEFRFDAAGLVPGVDDARSTLVLYVHNWTEGARATVRFRVNGSTWQTFPVLADGDTSHRFSIPRDLLRERGNVFELESGELETSGPAQPQPAIFRPQVHLDRLEVDYLRAYSAERGGLEFGPPRGAEGNVRYTVENVPPGAHAMVLDVTTTTPIMRWHGPAFGGAAGFDAPATATSLLLATADGATTVTLQPVSARPDLRSTGNAADYVIIAHPDFLAGIRPFADHKARAGRTVKVVDVRDVYDQFAWGEATPVAIKAFLRHAALHWRGGRADPAASFVLLVGDATSAYRNEFRNDVINYVPSYTVTDADMAGDRWASDHWYATLFGDDVLADALVGRFSVNNTEDLAAVVAKQIAYADAPTTGPWCDGLGFIADHTDFADAVERVIRDSVPPAFATQGIFLDDEPWTDNYYYPVEIADARRAKVSTEATRRIRDMINGGVAVLTFFGHGSPNIWSTERIWFGGDSENSDNLMLTNGARLPFIVNMTCNSGAIDYPQPRWNINITEDFMRAPKGGAVACFVPTGPGMTHHHTRLTLHINHAMLRASALPVGALTTLAGWRYLQQGNAPDLVRMFLLLGDPDLTLRLCPADNTGGLPSDVLLARPGTPRGSGFALLRHSIEGSDAAPAAGLPATLRARVRNDSPAPRRGVVFSLAGPDGATVATAPPMAFLPGEQRDAVFRATPTAGINAYRLRAAARGSAHPQDVSGAPIVVVGVHDSAPPFAVDPFSVTIAHRASDGGRVAVTVEATIHNVSPATSPETRAAIALPSGDNVLASMVTVPSLNPGKTTPLTISMTLDTLPESLAATLRLDALGMEPGSDGWPRVPLPLGRDALPDLEIDATGVVIEPASPMDGDTIWFHVPVRNTGGRAIGPVRVEAWDVTGGGTEQVTSRVPDRAPPVTLAPGGATTVTVRWDPFRNAGARTVRLTAAGPEDLMERDTENNTADTTVRVRTKHKLVPAGIRALPLTDEDRRLRRVRIAATVANQGESPATGVRVVFHAGRRPEPDNRLGDVMLDEVPAGASREAVFEHALKPEDQGRAFEFSYTIALKGSAQRVASH